MVLHINDIVSSPLVDDERDEVYAKDINLKELKRGMKDQVSNDDGGKKLSQKTTIITVKKTVVNADGSKTDFDTKFELTFQSPQEMKEYLDALGYSGTKQIPIESAEPSVPAMPAKPSKPSSIIEMGKSLVTMFNRFCAYIERNQRAYAEAERRNAERRESERQGKA